MKKILFLVLMFISVSGFGQKWEYSEMYSKFDGDYASCGIIGTGDFPYSNPVLIINYIENNQQFNVYFTRVIYAGCDNLVVKLAFDKSKDILEYVEIGVNVDNDTWFIPYSEELIRLLKLNSKLYVRLGSDCNQEDYEFSLFNSTTVINRLINYSKK